MRLILKLNSKERNPQKELSATSGKIPTADKTNLFNTLRGRMKFNFSKKEKNL